jgi:hypothetical protein
MARKKGVRRRTGIYKDFLRNLRTSQKASIRQERGNQMRHPEFQLYKHIDVTAIKPKVVSGFTQVA